MKFSAILPALALIALPPLALAVPAPGPRATSPPHLSRDRFRPRIAPDPANTCPCVAPPVPPPAATVTVTVQGPAPLPVTVTVAVTEDREGSPPPATETNNGGGAPPDETATPAPPVVPPVEPTTTVPPPETTDPPPAATTTAAEDREPPPAPVKIVVGFEAGTTVEANGHDDSLVTPSDAASPLTFPGLGGTTPSIRFVVSYKEGSDTKKLTCTLALADGETQQKGSPTFNFTKERGAQPARNGEVSFKCVSAAS